MTHLPADPEPLDVIARELHELMRLSNPGCPTWEDLDPADAMQGELIRMAREKAREFIPADDRPPDPQIPS